MSVPPCTTSGQGSGGRHRRLRTHTSYTRSRPAPRLWVGRFVRRRLRRPRLLLLLHDAVVLEQLAGAADGHAQPVNQLHLSVASRISDRDIVIPHAPHLLPLQLGEQLRDALDVLGALQ